MTVGVDEAMVESTSEMEEIASSKSLFRYVAKQPIFDRSQKTYGYELLFRNCWDNHFQADEEIASRHIVDNAIAFGMEWLVGSNVAFMNCTRRLILLELPVLLPRTTVLEIPADADVDEQLVSACKRMSGMGYRFAIDRYDFSGRWEPLLGIVDFIKVDFSSAPMASRRGLLRRLTGKPVKVVAARLETGAAYLQALQEGFHLFQGFFFMRPVVLSRPALPAVMQRLRFLSELSEPSLNFPRVLELLRSEPSMSYRILRLANAAAIGARSPISSLRMALVLVGENRFRKLAITALTVEMCGSQPDEAHRAILQRARFCELMAPACRLEPEAMYLLGMLAVVFRILDLDVQSMESTVLLHPEMMGALAGEQNVYGDVLQCAQRYDEADWDGFSEYSTRLDTPEEEISLHHGEAKLWADQMFADME